MNNKIYVKRVVIVATIMLSIVFGIKNNSYRVSTPIFAGDSYFNKQKVSVLGQIVGKNYIEEAPEEEMLEGIYKGFVYGVGDSKTMYLTEEEFTKMQVESEGDYIGTGIKFTWGITSQYLIVTEVVEGSPAEEVGIIVGDKITAIDGILAMMMNQEQIYEKLLYTGEDAVIYTIESNDGMEIREVSLVSRVIPIALTSTRMLDEKTGYIKIEGVTQGISDKVLEDIQLLKSQGATQFVIDIRNTATNEIDEVVQLANLFLGEGIALRIKDKEGIQTYYSYEEVAVKEPITLLVNSQTSGVMEGFVDAIISNDRGEVVGEKTAGDGTIQELIPLGDGSGLSITTGYIVDEGDQIIKGNGVEPTMEVTNEVEYILEIVTNGKVDYSKDLQLQEAIRSFE